MSWFNSKVKEEAKSIAEQTEKTMVNVAKDTAEAVVSVAEYVGEGIKETAEIGAYYVAQDAQAVAQGAKAVGEAISSVVPESVIATGETLVTDAAIAGASIIAAPEELVLGAAALTAKAAPTIVNASKFIIGAGVAATVDHTLFNSNDLKESFQKRLDDKQKQLDDLTVSSQKKLDDKQKQLDDKQKQLDDLTVSSQKKLDEKQKRIDDKEEIANFQKEKINALLQTNEKLQEENKLLKEKPLDKGKETSEPTQSEHKKAEPKQDASQTEKPLTPKELMMHMAYHRDEVSKTDDEKQQDYHLAQMENICTQIAELTGHTLMKGPELVAQVEPSQNQNQGMSR